MGIIDLQESRQIYFPKINSLTNLEK